jgi:hypothetical protein
MQTSNLTFFGSTDLVVVGHNSEMADYDNPRGEIIRSAAYVCAEDENGNRLRLRLAIGYEHEVLPFAEEFAARLTERFKKGKLPVGFANWEWARPAYGSNAYIESGQGEEDALLERMED